MRYSISQESINAINDILIKLPYNSVAQIIEMLKKDIKPIEDKKDAKQV